MIDGYNVMFSIRQAPVALQEGREWLISRLLPFSRRREVIVVFDAPIQPEFSRKHLEGLEIVFTAGGESADAYIISLLAPWSRRKQTTVITSDRILQKACLENGAHCLEPADFWHRMSSRIELIDRKPDAASHFETERWLQIFQDRLEGNQEED